MKTFFVKIGLFFGLIFSGLKWLDKHTPIWILYDIIWGVILGFLVYVALGHYLGHGLTPEQIAAGMVATSSFSNLAAPLGIFLGTLLAGWLLYWDAWSIKTYGKKEDGES